MGLGKDTHWRRMSETNRPQAEEAERIVPPYSLSALLYDRLVGQYAFEHWRENFERLRNRYALDISRVADAACGTGMAARFLAGQGSEVYACDLSLEMLRAAEASCGRMVELARQDMRYLSPPRKVNLIVCATDSLNHLLREEDIRRAFYSFHAALLQGGCALFDLNTTWQLREGADDKPWEFEIDGFPLRWVSGWDEGSKTATLSFIFPPREPGGRSVMELHRERAYEAEWLVRELKEAGFRDVEVLDAAGLGEVHESTRRLQFVAHA